MSKKLLILSIVSITTLFLGLTLFFDFSFAQPPLPGRCGDGICGPVEQQNPDLCPQDCQNIEAKKIPQLPPPGQTIKEQELPRPVQIELPQVFILADSFFYPFKRLAENIVTFLTIGKQNKLERHLYLAEKRLAEVQKLIQKKAHPKYIQETLKDYQEHLNKALAYQQKIKEPTPQLIEKTLQNLLAHQQVLQRVRQQVPEEAKEEINKTLEEAQKSLQQAIESVSKEKPLPTPTAEINFHQLASGKNFGNILKLSNPAIDEQNRKFYVMGSITTNVGVVDLNKNELTDVFDIGVTGSSFLIFSSNKLYAYFYLNKECYQIDTDQKKASKIAEETCKSLMPSKGEAGTRKWGNYTFKRTGYQQFPDGTSGFPTDWRQDLNAAYGVIDIYNSSNVKVGEIIFGPDALVFEIDQTTGKLYGTNTADGSISVFDLNKLETTNYCQDNRCWIKDIDIGNSIDEILVDSSDNNIYVRNRLGGSVIYKYNQTTKSLTIIDNENHLSGYKSIWLNNNWQGGGISMWPTGMSLSKDEKRLYVLSHYAALIDIVNVATNKVVNKIKFYPDYVSLQPRTDSISVLAVDKSRDKLYAVWPELGVIGIADGLKNKVLGTIDLTKYGFDKSKAANAGPGYINLAVNEKENKLYVYLSREQKLLVFNGDTFEKENEANFSVTRRRIGMLSSNDEKKVIYLENKIIDAATLKESGSFSKGQKVIAFNNQRNTVYLAETKPAEEKVYEFTDNSQTKEWAMAGSKTGIPSTFYFDFANNIFYAASFDGVVKKYNLMLGEEPSVSNEIDSTQQPSTGGQIQPPTGGTTQGKCGDGVCGPVEKEKGVCPEDCQ